jgi:hypothetical protein
MPRCRTSISNSSRLFQYGPVSRPIRALSCEREARHAHGNSTIHNGKVSGPQASAATWLRPVARFFCGGLHRLGLNLLRYRYRGADHPPVPACRLAPSVGRSCFLPALPAAQWGVAHTAPVAYRGDYRRPATPLWQWHGFLGGALRTLRDCRTAGGYGLFVDGYCGLAPSWRDPSHGSGHRRVPAWICGHGLACRSKESWRFGAG